MNSREFCLILLFATSSYFCFSQTADSTKTQRIPINLKVSYNSSLIYPGARLGLEFPFKTTTVTIIKKQGKEKHFKKAWIITANMGWYHHPSYHDNLYYTVGWTARRTKSTGFLTEFSPEMGLSRTYLGGTSYQVDNNGNVSIEKRAGYYYAFVSVGGGIGYDFCNTKLKSFIAFYKFNLITMFPYNSTIYIRPAMEIGVIYHASHFISPGNRHKR